MTYNFKKFLKSVVAAVALPIAVMSQEQVKPAASSREEVTIPIENSTSKVDAAWSNTTVSNMYTTAWGVPFNTTPVMNADLGVVVNGISADVYTNYVFKGGRINDLEFTVSGTPIRTKLADVSVSTGYWIFPDTGFSNAKSLKASISPKGLPFGLESSLSANKLWAKETKGVLYTSSLGKTFKLGKSNLSVGAEAVYNDKQYSGQSGFACVSPYASLNIPLTKSTDITLLYKNQNPANDFKSEGAAQRNVFKVKFNVDLKKLARK